MYIPWTYQTPLKVKFQACCLCGNVPRLKLLKVVKKLLVKKYWQLKNEPIVLTIIYRFYSGLGTPDPPSRVDTPKCPPLDYLIIK